MPLDRGRISKDVAGNNDGMLFTDMYLSAPVVAGLSAGGFISPSPIQGKCIPLGKVIFTRGLA